MSRRIPSVKALARPLIDCLKPENDYIPAGWETAHNIGRWWEAAVLMWKSIGMEIPSDVELLMSMHIRAISSNPYGLFINDPDLVSVSKLKDREILAVAAEHITEDTISRCGYRSICPPENRTRMMKACNF